MNIEEEMKLWEDRSNDEFGTILKSIREVTKDYLYSWEEMGIEYNILSEYITGYALDGNREYTAKSIRNILYNYDILNNDKAVKSLVNDLFKLI